MKILIVINSLGLGGAERVVQRLSSHYSNFDEVHLVLLGNPSSFRDKQFSVDSRVHIHRLNRGSGFIGRFFFLIKILFRTRPEVLISFTSVLNIYSILAGLFFRCRIIVREGNYIPALFSFKLSLVQKVLIKFLYPFADNVIFTTVDNVNSMDWTKRLKNSFVIPHFLDFNSLPQITHDTKENVVLLVARLVVQKNHKFFIDCIDAIVDKADWKFVLVGEGPLRSELIEYVRAKGLSEFIIFCDERESIEVFYRRAKIIALTSMYEGFAVALLEGMSFGCIPISVNCPTGPSDFVPERFLIPMADSDLFTSCMKNLLYDLNNSDFSLNVFNEVRDISSKYFINEIIVKWDSVIYGRKSY